MSPTVPSGTCSSFLLCHWLVACAGETFALVDDVALGDEVGIELLHDEVEVVGIGYSSGGIGIVRGIGVGTHSRSWNYGGQLETTVDFSTLRPSAWTNKLT